MTEAEYEFKLKAFAEFLALGPRVWRNWDHLKDRCSLGMQTPSSASGGKKQTSGALAAILYKGRHMPKAIGRSVLRACDGYELLLTPELMNDYDDLGREKILLHELVHLGYSGHRQDFRYVCKEVGGVLYGAEVNGSQVHLEQRQPNGRYKRMQTFDDEKAAKAWFQSKEQALKRGEEREAIMKANPGMSLRDAQVKVRWRMVWG